MWMKQQTLAMAADQTFENYQVIDFARSKEQSQLVSPAKTTGTKPQYPNYATLCSLL